MKKSTLYFRDSLRLDLGKIGPEQKKKFMDNMVAEGVKTTPPRLLVTVAATHAGIITRNNAFYRPDIMKDGISTFISPYQKPVQLHHSDQADPVGRVQNAKYIDISNHYVERMLEFRNRYGGFNFTDAKVDAEKAIDQYKWVVENMLPTKDYKGLGYGELTLSITDAEAAEKVLDQRYLTVSVGFTTTEARCSECNQDWASEGPCDHSPGQMYDSVPMSLIPGNFLYDEVSWVNNPADQFTEITEVQVTNLMETQQDRNKNSQIIDVVPILLGEDRANGIYRINFQDDVPEDPKPIEVNMSKKTKPAEAKFIEHAGSRWPEAASALLKDAKYVSRKHYLADEGDSDHKHRVVVDPETGNGYSDYVDGHTHEVVNMKVKETAKGWWDDETEEYKTEDPHTHPMGDEIPKLGYDSAQDSDSTGRPVPEGQATDRKKKKMKKKIKKSYDSEDQIPEDGPETKLIDADEDIPEGWELVEEIDDDAEVDDQLPPQAGEPKSAPAMEKKKKKAKKKKSSDQTQDEDDEIIEIEDGAEVPEGYELMEDEVEEDDGTFNDSVTEDVDKFYDDFVSPLIDELGLEDDVKLSADVRKELKASDFCGPNRSFPIVDCAHVTVARELLDRYTGDSKSKIKAAIERKARKLGCDKKQDATSVVTFAIEENEYAVSDLTALDKVLSSLGKDTVVEHKDAVFDVAKVFGITEEAFEEALGKDTVVLGSGETQDLDAAVDTYEQDAAIKFNESEIDKFVQDLANLADDSFRQTLVDSLISALVKAELIPDYDQEFTDMVEERDSLQEKVDKLTASNKDLYQNRQRFLAEKVVELSAAIGADDYKDLDDEAIAEKIESLQLRSVDSLNKQVRDLVTQLVDSRNKPGIENNEDTTPGSVEQNIETQDSTEGEEKVIDTSLFHGMDPHSYQLARRLRDSIQRSGLNGKRQG